MKIGVITDVHSNIFALKQAIFEMEQMGIEKYFFLGDYITDGPWDNEVLKIVEEKASYAVLGNRDVFVRDAIRNNKLTTKYKNKESLIYSARNLNQENYLYLERLTDLELVTINNKKILLIHGDKPLLNNIKLTESYDLLISKYDFDICFYGHTHRLKKEVYRNRLFATAGSIGQPNDGKNYKYLVVDTDNDFDIKFYNIPVESLFNDVESHYKQSDYYLKNPEWGQIILNTLKTGNNEVFIFMRMIHEKTKNISSITSDEYNGIFSLVYENYINDFNKR